MSHSNLLISCAIFLFTISVAMTMQIDHSVIEQKSNFVLYTPLYNQIGIRNSVDLFGGKSKGVFCFPDFGNLAYSKNSGCF